MQRWIQAALLAFGLSLLSVPEASAALDQSVIAVVIPAAISHGIDPVRMVRLAICESTTNRYAVNSADGAVGVFQLSPYGKLRVFYARGYTDKYDPAQQSNFTAEQIRAGEQWAWPNCWRLSSVLRFGWP